MLSDNKVIWGAGTALALLLGGCGTGDGRGQSLQAMPVPPASGAQGDEAPVMIGAPYQIGGTTYTPADVVDYDAVGYAGTYGGAPDGTPTASGESFNAQAVTAAHKTLPLPSYVEVTSIETGRTILVRVNDRGPLSNDRLIDLSEGAARQLGIADGARAGVRVRRVNPPEFERATLRGGGQAPGRLETPPALLRALSRRLAETTAAAAVAVTARPAPPPSPRSAPQPAPATARPGASYPPPSTSSSSPSKALAQPQPAAAHAASAAPVQGGGWSVQVGAFSTRARAETLAGKLGAQVLAAGPAYRVRLGPYATEAEARAAVAKAAAQGYGGGRIVRD